MAEQVQRLATANTFTICCCEHVGNTAAAHITHMNNRHIAYMNHLVADLYKWSWGSEGLLKCAVTATANTQCCQIADWMDDFQPKS